MYTFLSIFRGFYNTSVKKGNDEHTKLTNFQMISWVYTLFDTLFYSFFILFIDNMSTLTWAIYAIEYYVSNLRNDDNSIFFTIVDPHTGIVSSSHRFSLLSWRRTKIILPFADFRFLLVRQQGVAQGHFVVQSIWSLFLSRETLAVHIVTAPDPERLFVFLAEHSTTGSLKIKCISNSNHSRL